MRSSYFVSGLLTSAIVVSLGTITPARAGDSFTIFDAIKQAARTNPGVEEASANKRATEAELRQNQATLLPQVKLEARTGYEKFNQHIVPAPLGNDKTLHGGDASIVVRQLLFDGFASINQIWRQAARVDAGAARVLERTELIALDAAEAYISVVRYKRLVALAEQNLATHRQVGSNIQARFKGGRSGDGDLQLANERIAAAESTLHEFREALDEARAKYRKVVGLEPYNLRTPGRLGGLPHTKDESLAVALKYNPTIRAAQSDAEAAKYGFKATAGAFAPTVTLEGRLQAGRNIDTFVGYRSDESAMVVASWDIFRGGQDSWARVEAAERYAEQTARHARLQREAFESLDKAWAARTITNARIASLTRQVESARRVFTVYGKEFDVGSRTLIDLLDSQNQSFNASVSLVSARSVAVFADYQLLAVMGQLLSYLKEPHPLDAEPFDRGIVNVKIPPIIMKLPVGPEPLNTLPDDSKKSGWWPHAPSVLALQRASEEKKPAPHTQTASNRFINSCDDNAGSARPGPEALFRNCVRPVAGVTAYVPLAWGMPMNMATK
jgi:adhesin transport system outer membrane protein